jgi:hypothetical protein
MVGVPLYRWSLRGMGDRDSVLCFAVWVCHGGVREPPSPDPKTPRARSKSIARHTRLGCLALLVQQTNALGISFAFWQTLRLDRLVAPPRTPASLAQVPPPQATKPPSHCRNPLAWRESQFVVEGSHPMPSTPFVRRMGSSSFQSLRFRISMVPP